MQNVLSIDCITGRERGHGDGRFARVELWLGDAAIGFDRAQVKDLRAAWDFDLAVTLDAITVNHASGLVNVNRETATVPYACDAVVEEDHGGPARIFPVFGFLDDADAVTPVSAKEWLTSGKVAHSDAAKVEDGLGVCVSQPR